ncbi:MAG: META domain-containing protein [Winogradskyella sp.]|nr:META domain-containing protein [Winogradskyella sp.]
MRLIGILFLVVIMTTSCNSNKETIKNRTKNEETLLGTFYISQLGDNYSFSEKLSITFEDSTNNVSGFAGCNRFFGTYNLNEKQIRFENIASTKKFCQQDVNNLENEFLKVLNSTNTISIHDSIFSFLDGETVLMKAKK